MKFLLLLSLLAIPGLSHADDPFENTIHTEADGLFRVGPANAPFGPALAPNAEGVWTISLTDAFRYGLRMGWSKSPAEKSLRPLGHNPLIIKVFCPHPPFILKKYATQPNFDRQGQ